MEQVIVIGANYSSALGVVRALGTAGFEVKLLSINTNCTRIAGASKYVKQSLQSRRDYSDIREGLDKLRNGAKKTLVIPTDDISCKVLCEYDSLLTDNYDLPNIHHCNGELKRFMSKLEQKRFVEACGISTPKGDSYSTDNAGIKRAHEEIVFPCFLKPLGDKKASKEIMTVCSDHDDLEKAMKAAQSNDCACVLIEQYISVDKEYCLCGVAYNGKAYIPAVIEKTKVGNGAYKGVTAEAIVRKADYLSNEVSQYEQLISKLGLTGLFDIEVLESGEKRYLCEINLRNSAAGFGITAAGANLPGVLAEAMIHANYTEPKITKSDIQFISEKVALDDYVAGFVTWKEYKQRINSKSVHFIYDKDDKKPYVSFGVLAQMKRIKKMLRLK